MGEQDLGRQPVLYLQHLFKELRPQPGRLFIIFNIPPGPSILAFEIR